MRAHLIGFDRDDHSARTVAEGTLPISRGMFKFRCDQDAVQMAALHAGLGIGVMQTLLAEGHSDLQPVLADTIAFKLEIWLAVHQDQRDQPTVRAVFDGLAEGLSVYLAR